MLQNFIMVAGLMGVGAAIGYFAYTLGQDNHTERDHEGHAHITKRQRISVKVKVIWSIITSNQMLVVTDKVTACQMTNKRFREYAYEMIERVMPPKEETKRLSDELEDLWAVKSTKGEK